MGARTLTSNGVVDEGGDRLLNGGFSVSAFGTWGSGTLSFTGTVDGVNYFPICVTKYGDPTLALVTSMNADGAAYGNMVGLVNVRATLAGATSPNLKVVITAKTG